MGSTDRKLLYPIMYNIIKHRTFNSRLHNAVIYEPFFDTLLDLYNDLLDGHENPTHLTTEVMRDLLMN